MSIKVIDILSKFPLNLNNIKNTQCLLTNFYFLILHRSASVTAMSLANLPFRVLNTYNAFREEQHYKIALDVASLAAIYFSPYGIPLAIGLDLISEYMNTQEAKDPSKAPYIRSDSDIPLFSDSRIITWSYFDFSYRRNAMWILGIKKGEANDYSVVTKKCLERLQELDRELGQTARQALTDWNKKDRYESQYRDTAEKLYKAYFCLSNEFLLSSNRSELSKSMALQILGLTEKEAKDQNVVDQRWAALRSIWYALYTTGCSYFRMLLDSVADRDKAMQCYDIIDLAYQSLRF